MKRVLVLMLLIAGSLSPGCGPDLSGAPLWHQLSSEKGDRSAIAYGTGSMSDMLQLVAEPLRVDQLKLIEQGTGLSLETIYDSAKDKTTVRLPPVKISGEKAQYHSLHMSPSFSYPGKRPVRPSFIDFGLQTVVKGRLRTDLYVLFIIDGEKVFMSSSRSAVNRPVPGRVWMGERLVFRMPYDTLMKLAAAKKLEIKMDAVRFDVGDSQHQAIRDFAAEVRKIH